MRASPADEDISPSALKQTVHLHFPHKNEFQIKMNDFSCAQLAREHCVRSQLAAASCAIRARVFADQTMRAFHFIRKMKWSIFAVFSVFLCAAGAHMHCQPDCEPTHAGNGLMACEHCVANVIRLQRHSAFTLNDSNILRIFICDSELPPIRCRAVRHLRFSRVAILVYFVTLRALRQRGQHATLYEI